MGLAIECDEYDKQSYKIKIGLIFFFQTFSVGNLVLMIFLSYEHASYFLFYGLPYSLIFLIFVNFFFEKEGGDFLHWILELVRKLK
jgi:hypothetical protein